MIYILLTIATILSTGVFASSHYEIKVVQNAETFNKALLGGRVISSSVVSLSSQLSGDIVVVNGKEGTYFKKGDKIIAIESDSIQAKRDGVIAEISSAREDLKNNRVRYSQAVISPNSNQMFGGMFNSFTDPMNQMFGNSNPDFDKFANRTSKITGVRQSQNRLKQAELKLKQVEEQLSNATIKAPFDGVVVDKSVNIGDVVHTGQSLLKFSNLKQLQVEVDVPSRLMRELKVGSAYRVKIDTLRAPVIATLVQIYPIADNDKHSIKIKLDLPQDLPVLPGVYAELELTSKSGKTPTVIPFSSVLWRSSLPSVFVVNKYNKTELRFIRVGPRVDERTIEVLSGLKVGQRIVANPGVFTISGSSI